jgi:hypothetical protein
VAAAAILFVRSESGPAGVGSVVAQNTPAVLSTPVASSTPDSYVVPKSLPRRSIVPSTQLANYVVAHSEFSSPVTRRNLLSTLMANESGTAAGAAGSEEATEDASDDAKSPR